MVITISVVFVFFCILLFLFFNLYKGQAKRYYNASLNNYDLCWKVEDHFPELSESDLNKNSQSLIIHEPNTPR